MSTVNIRKARTKLKIIESSVYELNDATYSYREEVCCSLYEVTLYTLRHLCTHFKSRFKERDGLKELLKVIGVRLELFVSHEELLKFIDKIDSWKYGYESGVTDDSATIHYVYVIVCNFVRHVEQCT